MGLLGLTVLCQQLINHGLLSETPAAIIQQGTTQNQKVVTGTLNTLPELAKANNLKAPTLIIVGQVVQLHAKLAWFNPDDTISQGRILPMTTENKANTLDSSETS